jgi:Haem-NO-binding
MHGSLMHGFKKFVLARGGEDAWSDLSQRAGVPGWYLTNQIYADSDFRALVDATATSWSRPVATVLEEFGEAVVPTLLGLYGAFLERNWRTLDVLLNVEGVIHRTVRMRDRNAAPPFLRSSRLNDDGVQIEYTSARRLCAIAVGICRGVAAHYGDRISVTQPTCRERGDQSCRLVVRLLPSNT